MVITLALALLLQSSAVIWNDDDRQTIPEPKERQVSLSYDFITGAFAHPIVEAADMPRNFRKIIGKPKEAENINTVDEVPNSSWFTNRNFLHPMTPDEVARGPNRKKGPSQNKPWTVEQCKTDGITAGFRIRDGEGDVYLLKFDVWDHPELSTAVDVIGAKLFYAAGYNVPENYIPVFDYSILRLKPDLKCRDSSGRMTPMDEAALKRLLDGTAKTADGKFRAMASKFLDGKPKGPFSYTGWRRDDPNDTIAHEHRRELRGLRVIAAFLNHNDIKQLNTLDMYVEEDGRKFIKHHLIDFGSSLGSSTLTPKRATEGYEHVFDTGEVLKKALTLGIYDGRAGVEVHPRHPSIGYLEGETFDPTKWKPNFAIPAFENMTDRDGYWGAKIVASFTEEQLRAAIRSGEYSDPEAERVLLETLIARRDRVAEYWFHRVPPVDRFRVSHDQLQFDDLAVEGRYDKKENVRYHVHLDGSDRELDTTIELGAGIPIPKGKDRVRFEITRLSPGWSEKPVIVTAAKRDGVFEVIEVRR
jgi:hypothetical protein